MISARTQRYIPAYTDHYRYTPAMEESTAQFQRNQRALQELTRLLSRSDRTFENTVEEVLELGCRYLDLDIGFLSVVDAATILDRTHEAAVESWPEADIEVTGPDSLPVQADERLQAAVTELVDNAVEHYAGPPRSDVDGTAIDDGPTVRLTATPAGADGWVTIAVADDGPGIPETERWVLTGESEITQLSHSRGLGLWLVKWTVESFGGDIDITTGDGGSVVTIRLKQVDRAVR